MLERHAAAAPSRETHAWSRRTALRLDVTSSHPSSLRAGEACAARPGWRMRCAHEGSGPGKNAQRFLEGG